MPYFASGLEAVKRMAEPGHTMRAWFRKDNRNQYSNNRHVIEDSFVERLRTVPECIGEWRSLQPFMRLPLDPRLMEVCCHVAAAREDELLYPGNFKNTLKARPERCGDFEGRLPLDARAQLHEVDEHVRGLLIRGLNIRVTKRESQDAALAREGIGSSRFREPASFGGDGGCSRGPQVSAEPGSDEEWPNDPWFRGRAALPPPPPIPWYMSGGPRPPPRSPLQATDSSEGYSSDEDERAKRLCVAGSAARAAKARGITTVTKGGPRLWTVADESAMPPLSPQGAAGQEVAVEQPAKWPW